MKELPASWMECRIIDGLPSMRNPNVATAAARASLMTPSRSITWLANGPGSPRSLPHVGPLAQLAEQRTFNPRVPGSIPGRPTASSQVRRLMGGVTPVGLGGLAAKVAAKVSSEVSSAGCSTTCGAIHNARVMAATASCESSGTTWL